MMGWINRWWRDRQKQTVSVASLSVEECLNESNLTDVAARLVAVEIADRRLGFRRMGLLYRWMGDDSVVFGKALDIAKNVAVDESKLDDLVVVREEAIKIADTIEQRAEDFTQDYRKNHPDMATDWISRVILGDYTSEWFAVKDIANAVIAACLPNPHEALRECLDEARSFSRNYARSHTPMGSIVDEIMDNADNDLRRIIADGETTDEALAAAQEGAGKVVFT